MNVWQLVYGADSLTYTLAKAMSWGGYETSVWIVDRGYDQRIPDGIQRNLRQTPRVSLVLGDASALPKVIDRLIVQAFPRPIESLDDVGLLAPRARKIALISAGDRSRSIKVAMKLQWLEVRKLARHAIKVDRVLYKDGFYARDLLGMVVPRQVIGFDVHSQFLHNQDLFRAMHARDWDPESRRSILVNFLGSQDPESRKRVLDSVRAWFVPSWGDQHRLPDGKSMSWHEYADAAPIGLEPTEFVRRLTDSDLTLCPRGYSLVTHRPMEALLRGSIPVLAASELDLYGVALVDGENCIGVPENGWHETIRRLAKMGDAEFVRMRRNIFAMFDDSLNYDAVAKRLRARIGVPDD
jgi:hypothetical protein